jgi:hypothetical protein
VALVSPPLALRLSKWKAVGLNVFQAV